MNRYIFGTGMPSFYWLFVIAGSILPARALLGDEASALVKGAFAVTGESPATATLPNLPAEVVRVEYRSAVDGMSDWALLTPPSKGQTWVVFLHGHGSKGDQIYTDPLLRDEWLATFRSAGLGMVSANLRDNAWMSPAVADDLHNLLDWLRKNHQAKTFMFFSGSMGGTSNLVYATLHPEDCAAVVALGATTDMTAYYEWGMTHKQGIQREIAEAIAKSYGGTAQEKPDLYRKHSPLFNTDRLTMPLYLAHSVQDNLMPVEQMRALAAKLADRPDVKYVEFAGGDHGTPCHACKPPLEWLLKEVESLRLKHQETTNASDAVLQNTLTPGIHERHPAE